MTDLNTIVYLFIETETVESNPSKLKKDIQTDHESAYVIYF